MICNDEIKRPLVRYHGGKYRIAPWIVSFFPPHRCYVEPFGGGGSVLLRKPRSYAEIYNDLDGEIVNLFRMARDRGPELVRLVELTPFAREEFLEAWESTDDNLERARRTLVRASFGRGPLSGAKGKATFRVFTKSHNGNTADEWRNYPEALAAVVDRLRGVTIENRDAARVMQQHDSEETLHYVDPPYVPESRDAGKDYRHEMTLEQHRELAAVLHGLRGGVILSGYDSELYRELYAGWHRREKETLADGAAKRTEHLWMRNVNLLL